MIHKRDGKISSLVGIGAAAQLAVCWNWFGSKNSSLFEVCRGVANSGCSYVVILEGGTDPMISLFIKN